jgi:hypothetical protein
MKALRRHHLLDGLRRLPGHFNGWHARIAQQRQEPEMHNAVQRGKNLFASARDIARLQHAKSVELWTAMYLSRLWQRLGQKKAAGRLLAGCDH